MTDGSWPTAGEDCAWHTEPTLGPARLAAGYFQVIETDTVTQTGDDLPSTIGGS